MPSDALFRNSHLTATNTASLPNAEDSRPHMHGEDLLHRRDLWLLCLTAFVAMILSKIGTLLPGMSIDDYSYALGSTPGNTTYNLIAQGRSLSALISLAISNLNTSFAAVDAFSFFLASATISLAIAGSVTLIKRERSNQAYHYVAAAFAATHPYLTSYFLFRMSMISHAFIYASLFASLWLIAEHQSISRKIACVLLLVICSHISQIILILFAISAGAWSLTQFCQKREQGVSFISASSSITTLLVTLGLSTAFYFISGSLIRTILHVSATPIYSLHLNGGIFETAHSVLRLAHDALFADEAITPRWLKLLVIIIAVIATLLCTKRNLMLGVSCIVLLTCGTLATVSTMALSWGYLVPRTFSPIGLCLALTFCLACSGVKPHVARILAYTMIAPMIAFCLIGASLFYQQSLLTQWDQRTAAAIYNRLSDKFPEDKPIRIVASWPIHSQPLLYNEPGINESAFLDHWAYPGLFAIATGAKLNFIAGERSMCNGMPNWPNPGSMKRLDDDSILICMVR